MTADRTVGPVLVTGSSRGIGRATCLRLLHSGHTVYASARDLSSVADLVDLGCHAVQLDVTSELSMVAALAKIEHDHGTVEVLINNAGYGLYGPIEQVSIDEAREEFETNVFGLCRLTQLVLPGMRARGSGRIVNVSSIAGRVTFPGGAFYHASKFALEALSDSLRFEVAPFNIKVSIVEPGPVQTGWSGRAAASIPLAESDDDPYAAFKISVASMLMARQNGPARHLEASVERVARAIVRAATSRFPRTRYVVGATSHPMIVVRKILPDRLYDALLRRAFRLT